MSSDNETGMSKLIRQMREHDARIKALTGPIINMDKLYAPSRKLAELTKPAVTIAKIGEPLRLVSERVNRAIQVGPVYQPPIRPLRATDYALRLARGQGVAEEAPAYKAPEPQPAPPVPAQSTVPPPSISAVRRASDIGAMVRAARKAMKLNQSDFAAHAGVGRRFVSELESGKGSLEFDKVLACASAAGIDMMARRRSGG